MLMVKEKTDDKWALPGGFCDIGLSPSENIVKEIREESGYDVVPMKLLALLIKINIRIHLNPIIIIKYLFNVRSLGEFQLLESKRVVYNFSLKIIYQTFLPIG